MLTRRQFAVGSATIMSTGVRGSWQPGKAEALHFQTPLPIPKLIDAARAGNSVRLRAASGRHSFSKGKPAPTYGYSASILGPVIRLRRGDEVEMVVENALDCDTTVHWHGLAVPGNLDGPHQVIPPAGSWRPTLKIEQAAWTAWYHPHPHHDIARQVYMGLAGLIIVVLTGSDQVVDITKAHDLGANSYMVKPGDFNDLVEMVKRIKGNWLLVNRPHEPAASKDTLRASQNATNHH